MLASDFTRKAPPGIVQKEREKMTAYRETAEKLRPQFIVSARTRRDGREASRKENLSSRLVL
jgi:hypothetical protein